MNGTVTEAAFPGAEAGWALGTAGGQTRIWHTGTGGAAWQQQWQGSGTPLALTAADSGHAWALIACPGHGRAAACRELLGTADAGRRWRTLATLPAAVNEVSFVSPRLGVAIADGCLTDLSFQRCPGQVLVSHDGGGTWATVLTGSGPVFATASAGGQNRATQLWAAQLIAGGTQVRFLTSTDEGRTWQRTGQLTGLPLLSPELRIDLAVNPATGKLAWATVYDQLSCAMHGCFGGFYASPDGGRTWSMPDLPDAYPDDCGPADIALSVAPDGAAWLATGRNGAACAPPLGVLYRHQPGGGWRELAPWQFATAAALAAVNGDVAYAISDTGALARTADGGQHWVQVLPSPSPVGTSQLAVTGPRTALAAGDASNTGAILRSADGGQTWQQIADLPGVVTQLDVQPGLATAVTFTEGGRPASQLWTSADGGNTWQPGGRLPAAGTIVGPWMSADGHGLLLTITNGNPWEPQDGGSAPVREWTTSDGGQTWTEGGLLPLGTGSLQGAASFIYPGSLTYPGRGGWSGWLAVFTASFKQEVDSVTGTKLAPLPGSPPTDGLQLTGPGTGFAWGIDYAKAQVLTLYRTTDNGQTWQRSVFTLPASVQDTPLLGFSDVSDGWLVAGSRTWHTTDGGRTWH